MGGYTSIINVDRGTSVRKDRTTFHNKESVVWEEIMLRNIYVHLLTELQMHKEQQKELQGKQTNP